MKYKVGFLTDKTNNWIEKFLKKEKFKNNKKYFFKSFNNYLKIKNFDIIFILGYTKILNKKFLKKNKLNLVVHESNLPKGKGFAPVQWQILNKKKNIPICLIEAKSRVDSGNIYEKMYFKIKNNDLYDQIREKQAIATIKIIKKFLKKFPKVKPIKQLGKSTFYKRRRPADNLLDINKSIKENFNLLRIGNNELFPSYFNFRSKKFIIKIFNSKK